MRDWRVIPDGVSVAEGYDWFAPSLINGQVGEQPFPLAEFDDPGPINLIHMCERPDHKKALVVGTARGLYRFVGGDDLGVYEDGVFDDGVFVAAEDFGTWVRIGEFKGDGKRWQAVNAEEYTIFNNEVDLPVVYRVGDAEVIPMYELREVGVANVGCIAGYAAMLFSGDVTEIKEEAFNRIMSPFGVESAGDILGSLSGTTFNTNAPFFKTSSSFPTLTPAQYWQGRYIKLESGEELRIVTWVDEQNVVVDTSGTISNKRFEHYVKASQIGAWFSGPITATTTSGSKIVTASSACFSAGDVLKRLILANGWSSVITAVNSPTEIEVSDAVPDHYVLPFWKATAINYLVSTTAPFFLEEDKGKTLIIGNGETRTVVDVIDYQTIEVSEWVPVSRDIARIERKGPYDRVSTTDCNRFQHRIMWSMLHAPNRYGANFYGKIEAGNNILLLKSVTKSIVPGMKIVIAGAGKDGGNLEATVILVAGGMVVALDTVAETSVENALVQASDSISSVTGYDEPFTDYSRIVNMRELAGTLVIYKRTSIMMATFTGDVNAPIAFKNRPIPEAQAIYYKHTLASPGNNYHVYAAANRFYTFDLSSQTPVQSQQLLACQSVFFDNASVTNDEEVFAVDNGMTQEIWFVAGGNQDAALCIEYQFKGAVRTTSARITAGATTERLSSTDRWFLMALEDNTLVVYGLTDEPMELWDGKNQIYYRRSGVDGEITGYEAVLESGLESFGPTYNEKHLAGYQLTPFSINDGSPIKVSILSANSPMDNPTVQCTIDLDSPANKDYIPLHYIARYFGDRIVRSATLTVIENGQPKAVPNTARLVLTQRAFHVAPITSEGWTRR